MPYAPRIGARRTEQFVIRVSEGEIAAIARIAESSKKTRSDYVRDLIRADLATRSVVIKEPNLPQDAKPRKKAEQKPTT